VGSAVVVLIDEGIEEGLELGDRGRLERLFAEPFLQRLLEALDLAAGGRVAGSRVLLDHVPAAELDFESVAAFLMVGTIAGILMATFLNNSGGAWDNAKKFIETGAFGGKGSDPHKAAVVGDTVGDPFKDTAGPSLHVLIKLLSTITLVLAPLFV